MPEYTIFGSNAHDLQSKREDRYSYRDIAGQQSLYLANIGSLVAEYGLPKVLPKDSCFTITVRMDLLDSSKTLLDTLRIMSDEICPGSGVIPGTRPRFGRVQDVLGVLQADGTRRRHAPTLSPPQRALTAVNFGEVCPGFLSDTQTFQ